MRRRSNKMIALLLASAMLTTSVGMVPAFAAGEEERAQETQKEEKEEKTEQTQAPAASVKEGTYSTVQNVTLKSAAKDAVIYYTTDGKEPTEQSSRFDEKKPIEIRETTTIKAIAVAKDTGKSKTVSFTYKIEGSAKEDEKTSAPEDMAERAQEPEETPAAEAAAQEQGEAQLMPAGEPEEQAGEETPAAEENKKVESASMVQEVETEADMDLAEFNKKEDIQTAGGFSVEEIKWENAANASETKFKPAEQYKVTVTLKADEGFEFDAAAEVTFNDIKGVRDISVTDKVVYVFTVAAPSAPQITPKAADLGAFTEGKDTAELQYAGTDGAKLEYSLDGVDWKEYSKEEKILLSADETGTCKVTARAVLNYIAVNASEEYKVKVAKPAADVEAGTYEEARTVKLSSVTEEAKIYYTTDGTEPTDKSTQYEAPIEIKETTTLKAIAYKGSDASAVSTFEYVIKTPTSTETPKPQPEVKLIKKISVLDLDKPSRGAKPDRKAKASSDTHATVESVEWLKDNKGNDIEGVFKANTIYYAYVHLKAKDGYSFDTETFVSNSTSEHASVSNYSHNPGVKSASESDVVVYVAWKTQPAVTASASGNTITGLRSSYSKGATVTFTMNGAGADNPKEEGNERYVPIRYKISSSEFKFEDNQNPKLSKSFRISTAGTYTLTATFQKQVYDANEGEWKNVDGETDTKTATVKIGSTSPTSGTLKKTTGKTSSSTSGNSTKDSSSSKSKNAKTGDETPIGAAAAVFVVAGAAAAALLVRRRKSQK